MRGKRGAEDSGSPPEASDLSPGSGPILALTACIGFLGLAALLFWLSRLIHPELADDAAISAGCAAAALGAVWLGHGGLLWGLAGPLLLLAAR